MCRGPVAHVSPLTTRKKVKIQTLRVGDVVVAPRLASKKGREPWGTETVWDGVKHGPPVPLTEW
jgi:hypothetical protein